MVRPRVVNFETIWSLFERADGAGRGLGAKGMPGWSIVIFLHCAGCDWESRRKDKMRKGKSCGISDGGQWF